MTSKRARHNGEGSIFPYRNGFAAYVWVTKPDGTRDRKWVYGKEREEVHDKWLNLHQRAREGPVATKAMTLARFARYWLAEIVRPNLSPGTYVTYESAVRNYVIPGLGDKRLERIASTDVQRWLNSLRAILSTAPENWFWHTFIDRPMWIVVMRAGSVCGAGRVLPARTSVS